MNIPNQEAFMGISLFAAIRYLLITYLFKYPIKQLRIFY